MIETDPRRLRHGGGVKTLVLGSKRLALHITKDDTGILVRTVEASFTDAKFFVALGRHVKKARLTCSFDGSGCDRQTSCLTYISRGRDGGGYDASEGDMRGFLAGAARIVKCRLYGEMVRRLCKRREIACDTQIS
ncbi:MAG: hypothetical protein ABR985_00565 [Methanotrichaceae archaeon]|jgi:hypothetical protein